MMDKKIQTPHQSDASSNGKRVFVKPEIRREAKLPEITNAFVGSFDPGDDVSTQV